MQVGWCCVGSLCVFSATAYLKQNLGQSLRWWFLNTEADRYTHVFIHLYVYTCLQRD